MDAGWSNGARPEENQKMARDGSEEVTRTTVPAQPGWFVAVFVDGEEPHLSYKPIVAWEIERFAHHWLSDDVEHRVEPLTCFGAVGNDSQMGHKAAGWKDRVWRHIRYRGRGDCDRLG
jgi:hypothetical protein